jgi:hypothetical protein
VFTMSSRGARGLGDWAVVDDGDTCQDRGGAVVDTLLHTVWWFGPQKYRRMIFRFGPQTPVGVPAGKGGGTWCHREAYIEAKQSHEELMAIGCLDHKLDHFALGLKWFGLNI